PGKAMASVSCARKNSFGTCGPNKWERSLTGAHDAGPAVLPLNFLLNGVMLFGEIFEALGNEFIGGEGIGPDFFCGRIIAPPTDHQTIIWSDQRIFVPMVKGVGIFHLKFMLQRF